MPVFNIENPSSRAQRGRNNRARGRPPASLAGEGSLRHDAGRDGRVVERAAAPQGADGRGDRGEFPHGDELYAGHDPGAASPIRDSTVLTRLARDLRRGGSVLTTYRVIQRGNTTLIALRGYAGLRQHLPASLYGAQHPTIIRMAVGPAGQRAMASGGIIVTAVVSPAVRTFQWIFDDEVTWRHMLVNVSMDMAKAVTAAGGFIAGAKLAVVGGVAFGLAVPVIVPVGVGFAAAVAVGLGLSYLDDNLRVSERLIDMLTNAQENWKDMTTELRRETGYFFGTHAGQLEFMRWFSGRR